MEHHGTPVSDSLNFSASGDPLGDHQIFWSTIFMVLVSSAEARARMRLTGISQRLDGEAGWYLWRADQPGAYSLEIGEARAVPGGRETHSRCWIKYYPALTDDQAFAGLSSYERELRAGALFDETGTPILAAAASIPQEAFLVGYLDLRLTGAYATLCLLGQDFWRVLAGPSPGTAPHPGADAPVRDLPGWELAWPIADVLIMAWCMFFARQPLAAVLTERPGEAWEYVDGAIRAVPAADIPCRELFCLLSRPEGQGKLDPFGVAEEWLAEPDSARDLVWMLIQPPDEALPWLNPDWWKVSQALGDVGLCCLADNRG
jgi:hypothetical protein